MSRLRSPCTKKTGLPIMPRSPLLHLPLQGVCKRTSTGTATDARKKSGETVSDRLFPDVSSAAPAPQAVNQYEQERLERMQRNAAKLQQLAVQQRLVDLQEPVTSAAHTSKTQQRRSKAPAQRRQAVRTSARVRGIAVEPIQPLTTDTADVDAADTMQSEEAGPSGRDMMTQQEYMRYTGMQADSIASDGHFNGWVNAAVCQQCGIANNASDAWSQNGGGKFSFKIDKSAIPASLKAQGWSNARAFSATQLKQNPNTFFYRNVAPGEVQAFGDWSENEHELFLETAKKYGVGDKWGLFASYIPQRVGYQCSAYYRDVIIPACLVLDTRFKLSAQGKAVFQG